MAKKDPSLSLEYILQKQESEKLSGLSSTVKSQLGNIPPAGSGMPPENKILSELKKINDSLNVGLNKNILKMTKAIENSTSTLAGFIKGSRKQVPPQTKNDLSQQDIEDKDYKNKELKLLQDIRDGLKVKDKKKDEGFPWLTALTVAVAAAVAALRTWAKLVKDIILALTPSKLKAIFAQSFDKWVKGLFKDLKLSGKQIADFFKPISNVFKEIAESKWIKGLIKDFNLAGKQISGFFESFKGTFSYLTNAFKNAFKVIKTLVKVESIMSLFSGIVKVFEGIGKFAGMFAKFARTFGRVFKPIGIIFAIFDTITGAIEGYAKEGMIGAISGAIKGFFGDFVLGFFDLVKDGISFVLDKIGLDSLSKALDSFSFVDIFKNFVDMIFHPIDTIKNIINKITDWMKTIELPALKVFGKTIIPARKLFADEETTEPQQADMPKQIVAPAIEVTPEKVMTPPPTAAEAIYDQSAKNEEAAMYPVAAPTNNIVNAPTTITKQTQNNLLKVNVRNQDTSLKDYYRSRFAT
jgi:hypothetical protein